MTDNEKIQEEFERWWNKMSWYDVTPTNKDAFTAGYIRGQQEAYIQMIADDAQVQGDYEV